MEDSQIIASFKNDDRRAIEQLYDQFRPKFMNWLKGTYHIGRQEDAGEIYQRCFTVLYMNGKKGMLDTIGSSVETYLFGVAKFQVLAKEIHYRQRPRKFQNIPLSTLHY